MIKEGLIHISKIDAAKRQLEIAIRLFFSNGDVVAIHTLTAAAYNLMKDLSKLQGKHVVVKDIMLEKVKPEYKKTVSDKINEAENFFKHADNDPTKLLEFNPVTTEFLLWDACVTYRTLTSEEIPLTFLFIIWFYTKNTDLLGDKQVKQTVTNLLSQLNLDYNNRSQFLELLPKILQMNF